MGTRWESNLTAAAMTEDPFDPNLSNDHNVTQLSDLRISYLTEVILGRYYRKEDLSLSCEAASHLLPLENLDLLNITVKDKTNDTLVVTADPTKFDVGLLSLKLFAKDMFPAPLNATPVNQVAAWWENATTRDAKNVTEFLSVVVDRCGDTYCRSDDISIGNVDIIGIGVSKTPSSCRSRSRPSPYMDTQLMTKCRCSFRLPCFSSSSLPSRLYHWGQSLGRFREAAKGGTSSTSGMPPP